MTDREVKPWDLLNPNRPRSEDELQKYRINICEQCPLFRTNTRTCSMCGCFMDMKTKLLEARCPDGKW